MLSYLSNLTLSYIQCSLEKLNSLLRYYDEVSDTDHMMLELEVMRIQDEKVRTLTLTLDLVDVYARVHVFQSIHQYTRISFLC